jgi:hypothetical protein
VKQSDLFDQLLVAFTPFQKWTPKATAAFIETMRNKLGDLNLYTQKMSGELAGHKLELRKRIDQLEKYRQDGVLSQAEFDAAVSVPFQQLEEKSVELSVDEATNLKDFQESIGIIQLFQKVYDFMKVDGFELEKIKMAKGVLSNPTLANRTLRYHYKKPLDVLLSLTERPIWWIRTRNLRFQVLSRVLWLL